MAWINKPVNKAILIGAAVLLVVSIVAIIWGVTTHKEQVLLEGCWENDLITIVEGHETSCDPDLQTEIKWNRQSIPLNVTPMTPEKQPLAKTSDGYEEIQKAVNEVNLQFGYNHFQMSSVGTNVEVLWGVSAMPGRKNSSGFCRFYGADNVVYFATIGIRDIRDISPINTTFKILVHELGHVAGLRHDVNNPEFIMFPILEDRSNETNAPLRYWRFTDSQIRTMRSLYNR